MSRYEDAVAAIGAGRRGIITERLVRGAAVPLHALDTLRSRGLLISLGRAFGLPEPEKQAVVTDIEGWIGTVDFLWRAERVIVEIDSTWHDGPLDQERDEERDLRAEAAGYVVCRYRYRHLVDEPNRVHRELVVAMRRMTV